MISILYIKNVCFNSGNIMTSIYYNKQNILFIPIQLINYISRIIAKPALSKFQKNNLLLFLNSLWQSSPLILGISSQEPNAPRILQKKSVQKFQKSPVPKSISQYLLHKSRKTVF